MKIHWWRLLAIVIPGCCLGWAGGLILHEFIESQAQVFALEIPGAILIGFAIVFFPRRVWLK